MNERSSQRLRVSSLSSAASTATALLPKGTYSMSLRPDKSAVAFLYGPRTVCSFHLETRALRIRELTAEVTLNSPLKITCLIGVGNVSCDILRVVVLAYPIFNCVLFSFCFFLLGHGCCYVGTPTATCWLLLATACHCSMPLLIRSLSRPGPAATHTVVRQAVVQVSVRVIVRVTVMSAPPLTLLLLRCQRAFRCLL